MLSKLQYCYNFLINKNSNSILTDLYIGNRGLRGQLKIQNQSHYFCLQHIITHEPKDKKFYCRTSGKTAYLRYRFRQNNEIFRILSINVPKEIEGQGIAKCLTEGAFNYVKENNLKMEVVCRFALDYLEKTVPEYKQYLVDKKQNSHNKKK